MFVRKKQNKSGSVSIQIIQKQNGKYRVVQTVGSSKNPDQIDFLYHQAQLSVPRLFNQTTLFDQPSSIPPLTELGNDDIRVVGPELIFGKIFDHIGYNKIPDQTSLFISFSSSRARKDQSNRERGLKRLEKNLKSGKLTKSNINNRGYNKYLKLKGEVKIEIDYQKFDSDAKWDGLKGYITNTKLTGTQVIDSYNNLWKIEKAFRISKTDLKIRPIYHRLRPRIEAHICLSFVAYVLYKELERVLNQYLPGLSITKAVEKINKMYEVSYQNSEGKTNIIRLKNNPSQQRIIDTINLNF